MGQFTDIRNHETAVTSLSLPTEQNKRLHLVGVKARVASDISLKISSDAVISAKINDAPFDGPKGIWVVDLSSKAKQGSATVEAYHQNTLVAKIEVSIFQRSPIHLPSKGKQALLSRLFLVESINPGNILYNENDVKTALKWMRIVIENRSRHSNPRLFYIYMRQGASTHDVFDVVKAKGQFHGFENYPSLTPELLGNINQIMGIANNYNHPLREQYAAFVNNVIWAASNESYLTMVDPSSAGLYGWRTLNSSHPGGSFERFKDLAGQTFYTLKGTVSLVNVKTPGLAS